MKSKYLLQLEERSAKLWGVISQLEAKRIAELESFALNDDQDGAKMAARYAQRIAAAKEANEALEKAIETEEKGRLILPKLSTEEEITIIHRAYHRGWDGEKTQRFILWLNNKRKAVSATL